LASIYLKEGNLLKKRP